MSTILITGGSGYLGRCLASKLRDRGRVVIGARNQANLQWAAQTTKVDSVPLNVSDIESVRDAVTDISPNILIHAAASKFVDLAENQSMECVDVNVVGSQNVARVAISSDIEFVIGVSTDKAAPPTSNIYGLTKALMERMFISLDKRGETRFSCVRGGNITWSTGSVLPIWKEMLRTNNLIESTGPDMSRFFFSVEEAANLVITALDNKKISAGRILTQQMRATKIRRILDIWTQRCSAEWREIEPRPGDQQDQLLIGSSELPATEMTHINGIAHYLITPNMTHEKPVEKVVSASNSPQLTDEEIEKILDDEPSEKLL